jgi:hypothetical protein
LGADSLDASALEKHLGFAETRLFWGEVSHAEETSNFYILLKNEVIVRKATGIIEPDMHFDRSAIMGHASRFSTEEISERVLARLHRYLDSYPSSASMRGMGISESEDARDGQRIEVALEGKNAFLR